MTDTFTGCAKEARHHHRSAGRLKPVFRLFIVLLLLSSALLLSGCGDKEQKQSVAPRPVRFIVAPPPVSGIPFIRTGEIRAHDEIMLGFRVDGRLLSRTVDVGDHVQAGQVMATVESDTSQNQLRSARADLDSAHAAERVAALNLQRMKQLMPQGAIARVQYDTAQSDWQTAVSRRQSSEAALKNAQDNLSWTRLTAPRPGVITSVSASPGQVLGTGQTVVTLAVSSGLDAVFDLSDPQIITRNAGVPFTLSLLSDPSVHTTGHLRDISPQADPQTRTWRVRFTLDTPPDAMALGASVQGEMEQAGKLAMALPATALTRLGEKPAVFIVDRATLRLQLRSVDIARFTRTAIFISDGVSPGDMVVTAGVSKLRQGEKVTLAGDIQ
ncbi:efflux RND transporter periplasmic adaptor subunit [Sodalis sp. RH21]|uniref:efflux RND transporter periplasmic adaptor subunit n=1 Tax=unclassified Sodalis (in: enterobacteria) TaxID=2636512 RepID=UPI0039B66330